MQKTIPTVTYKPARVSDCFGTLTIWGAHMPPNKESVYDPIAKIWANIKKVFVERYGVHISATFHYRHNIICQFYVDNAYGEYHKISQEVLRQRFKQAWDFIIADFEDALEAFFCDTENGYLAYCEVMRNLDAIGDEKAKAMCNNILNSFLRSINLRDLRNKESTYSHEERELIKKARAERKALKKLKKRVGEERKELLNEYGISNLKKVSRLAKEHAITKLEREELARRNTHDEFIAWSIEELFERA